MSITLIIILTAIISAGVAICAHILVRNVILKGKREEILKKAEAEGEALKKEKIFQAKEKFLQLKSEHEAYINERNAQALQMENKLKQRELTLNQQNADLGRKQKEVETLRENLKGQIEVANKKGEEYEKLRGKVIEKLEEVAGMTASEAKNQLVENMKAEARTEAMSYINEVMDEARINAGKEAKRIVINTIQRTAPEMAI